MAVAGLVCGVVGLVLAIVNFILAFVLKDSLTELLKSMQ
jgi:hypothetical protein